MLLEVADGLGMRPAKFCVLASSGQKKVLGGRAAARSRWMRLEVAWPVKKVRLERYEYVPQGALR